MTCGYCGKDNPEGSVYCSCGMPLTYERGGGTNGFVQAPAGGFDNSASQGFGSAPRSGMGAGIPKKAIFFVIGVLLFAAVYFGYGWFTNRQANNEDSWQTIEESLFTMKAPASLKKDKMLTVMGSDIKHICFYTSYNAGFDVNLYKYKDDEKELLGKYTAADYLKLRQGVRRSINDYEVHYSLGSTGNYMYCEYPVHRPNYVGKSDEVWLIEATYPIPKGYYIVEVYCAESDKDAMRDSMFKWLDSFTIRFPDDEI